MALQLYAYCDPMLLLSPVKTIDGTVQLSMLPGPASATGSAISS